MRLPSLRNTLISGLGLTSYIKLQTNSILFLLWKICIGRSWMSLTANGVKDFIRRLLGKIGNSHKVPRYDFVLFDCPPSFTLLSYSVLSCCDLVLIPVNPDFFASKGVGLILNSLRMRIEPHPIPKIGIFMNKAKTWRNSPTNEVRFYMRKVERACSDVAKKQKIDARFFNSFVRERVGIKRAITGGGVPPELVPDFQNLWRE